MAERKVLNKYFPPDFDVSLIPKMSGGSTTHKVRLMAPFSMRCESCGEFVYKGKKFNARKETVWGEDYLGIRVYRFFIRCPMCSAEITFKTDPKNADYVCEKGASRNFEAWREESVEKEESTFRKQLEEEMDPMKKLENKTVDAKREIAILEALDELRTRNARFEKVNADAAMERLRSEEDRQKELEEERLKAQDEEDSRIAKMYFETEDGVTIKRLYDDLEEGTDANAIESVQQPPAKKAAIAIPTKDLNKTKPEKKITAKSIGIKIKKK
ncbi:hypothetical protein MP638_005523 [Amoeboaphelidium occidentale]|nr:hypothetical protein MP638_005523 [Amoeboaphelidium occidentale]